MKKYRPRVNRVDPNDLPSFRLTDRDYDVVKAVHEYGMLTSEQIRRLLFVTIASGQNKSNQRLSKLYHHGYLERIEEPTRNSGEMNKPLCYFLGKRGAEVISLKEGIPLRNLTSKSNIKDISLWLLEHTKLINDVRISIVTAIADLGYKLIDWKDENQLEQLHKNPIDYLDEKKNRRKSKLIPDSYFCVQDSDGYISKFFIEVDRATETVRSNKAFPSFTKKIFLYQSFLNSGMFSKIYGGRVFRVLTVTTSAERAENLTWAVEQIPNIDYFCFTMISFINKFNAFADKIWAIPHRDDLISLLD